MELYCTVCSNALSLLLHKCTGPPHSHSAQPLSMISFHSHGEILRNENQDRTSREDRSRRGSLCTWPQISRTHTHTQSFLSFWALSPYKNRPHSHFQFFFSSLHPLCMRTNLAGSRRRRHSPSLSCPQLIFFLQVAGFRFLGKANPPFHCVLLPSPLLPHLSHNPPNCSQEHTAKNAAKLLARILGDFY